MAVQKRWQRYTKENIEKLPNVRGLYEIADPLLYQAAKDRLL